MTEQELRMLVRDAIARHTGAASGIGAQSGTPAGVLPGRSAVPFLGAHASHGMFVLPVGADADGPCVIEPAVTCTHCGYCKSYGH